MKELTITELGKRAAEVKGEVAALSGEKKRVGLIAVAEHLVESTDRILDANALDMERAKSAGMPGSLQDRLALDAQRIEAMAEGVRQVADLDDPIGSMDEVKRRPNGLMIGTCRVPIGVIGIIYESRPNVTADAFALTFKTGNVVILKGGSDAIDSNKAIVECIRESLKTSGLPEDAIQLIMQTDRETTREFMRMNDCVDLLIPRGGAGLINSVKENSTIPVIETGVGNCHIYVDEAADISMAVPIIVNAKTQRLGVCNACESLVVHSSVAERLLGELAPALAEKNVEMRCDERALPLTDGGVPATEEDWGTEYLDSIISIKTVDSVEEAIAHINRYNTGHSEAIITDSLENSARFTEAVDSACVYVNASTRFTDGFEFGFGAEIGISTQKLHARGPMGLKALTTVKYIITGSGQIRG